MEIVNRVANSPLITLNLEDYYVPGERVVFDLKELLYMEQILREKDFRAAIQATDWSLYKDKHVALYCSVDAIVPVWAYMLVASQLQPYAQTIIQGDPEALESALFHQSLDKLNTSEYHDKKVVVKGCGDKHVPVSAYTELTRKLRPFVSSIAYGEPCSTVPVYKKPKTG
jgi:hypothetical protein